MSRRIASRAGQYLLVLWVALSLGFVLPRLAPGEPLDYLLGNDASGLTAEQRARVLAQYGLDRPVPEQYARYLGGLATGDLGTSARTGRSVATLLATRLPWTLALAIPALLASTVIGVVLGALAAWRRTTRFDHASTIVALGLTAVPSFWLGMILIAIFAVALGWLPSLASLPVRAEGIAAAGEIVARLVLPIVTLTAALVGGMFLIARAAVLGTLGDDFLLLAAAKGLTPRTILVRHALRNALLPIVTNAGLMLGTLIGGSVIVETVFGVPGIGGLIYQSVLARDYPTLQGAFLLTIVGVVAANLLADLAYPLLDPRVRTGRAGAPA